MQKFIAIKVRIKTPDTGSGPNIFCNSWTADMDTWSLKFVWVIHEVIEWIEKILGWVIKYHLWLKLV